VTGVPNADVPWLAKAANPPVEDIEVDPDEGKPLWPKAGTTGFEPKPGAPNAGVEDVGPNPGEPNAGEVLASPPPPNPEEPNAEGAVGVPNADGDDPAAKPNPVDPNFEVEFTFPKAPKPCAVVMGADAEGEDEGVCPKAETGCG